MKRLLVIAALIGLAACGNQTVTAGDAPADANALVARVEMTGGFVPVETIFTNLPVVSIYADGRVIQIPRWQSWARAAEAKLEELLKAS